MQGRGSAANSAVCYSLGITAVDPVGMDLLFERFLSEERGEWPDIDLDLPSGDRRERVIQHIYEKYGRGGGAGAGGAAGAPRYHPPRAARRDDRQRDHLPRPERGARSRQGAVARAGAGRSAGQGDEPLRVGRSRRTRSTATCARSASTSTHPDDPDVRAAVAADPGSAAASRPALRRHGDVPRPARRGRAARERQHARSRRRPVGQGRLRRHGHRQGRSARPRHDGGAAGCAGAGQRPGPARPDGGRDAAVDLAHLPPDDPAVYRMLQEADTIGIFQVESRAQMATLPRLRPAALLRHRRRSRDHPARADRRADGASVS